MRDNKMNAIYHSMQMNYNIDKYVNRNKLKENEQSFISNQNKKDKNLYLQKNEEYLKNYKSRSVKY